MLDLTEAKQKSEEFLALPIEADKPAPRKQHHTAIKIWQILRQESEQQMADVICWPLPQRTPKGG